MYNVICETKITVGFYIESFQGRNPSIPFSGTHNLSGAMLTSKEQNFSIFKKIDIYFPSKNVLTFTSKQNLSKSVSASSHII